MNKASDVVNYNGQVGKVVYLFDPGTGLPVPGGGGLVKLTDAVVIADITNGENWTPDYIGPDDGLSDNHYYRDEGNLFYIKLDGEWLRGYINNILE